MSIDDLRPVLEAIATRSRSRVEIWVPFIAEVNAISVAELGVWKGEFAAEILKACSTVSTYYMIDPWRHLENWNKPANVTAEMFEKVRSEAMQRTKFASARRRVLRGTTLETIGSIDDGTLDFAYVDGDHTLRGIATDLIALLPKMRPGGVIGGDDFCPNIWQHGSEFEPTFVFPFAVHFALAIGAVIYGLPFDQFLIVLPEPRRAGAGRFMDLTGRYPSLDLLGQMPPVGRGLTSRLRHSFSRLDFR
jgi:Methyltransferase domain